jgi:hypothetical protein
VHSLPRFFLLNNHIDGNISLSKGNGSRGREG